MIPIKFRFKFFFSEFSSVDILRPKNGENMKRSILIFLAYSFCLSGQEPEAPLLKGVRLVPSKEDVSQKKTEWEGIEILVPLPGSMQALCEKLSAYLSCQATEETILEIKKTIIQFYRKNNRPIVAVLAPKQDASSGLLELVVVEGSLGTVEVHGNKYFSDERLKQYLGLNSGGPILSDRIQRGLISINQNPFRQADIVYKPGEKPGTTDIELVVQDRRPYRFYTGVDNTGNSVTGNNRLFAGFNWGNAFNLDHQLSFQFSSSDNFHRFLGYVGRYAIPLPIRHLLSLYGGYSTVDADFEVLEAPGVKFRNSGYNAQASLRYDFPISPLYSFLQELSFGCDFKRMNNNLEFGGEPVFSKSVNLFQLMASYNIGYESNAVAATFEIEGFGSFAQWLPDQSDATYQTLRPFAETRYFYSRGSFSLVYFFHPWLQANLFVRGQLATANLLPSEEYGIGGYDTVRGYQEREANGDNALNINLEFSSAPFPLSKLVGIRKGRDQMQILTFFDYGSTYIHTLSEGEKRAEHLYSAGAGMRYQILTYLTARIDWGYQFHHITPDTPHQRLHFQFIGSF